MPPALGAPSRRSRDRSLRENAEASIASIGWRPAGRHARTDLQVVPRSSALSLCASRDRPSAAGPRPSRRLTSGQSRRWSWPRERHGQRPEPTGLLSVSGSAPLALARTWKRRWQRSRHLMGTDGDSGTQERLDPWRETAL